MNGPLADSKESSRFEAEGKREHCCRVVADQLVEDHGAEVDGGKRCGRAPGTRERDDQAGEQPRHADTSRARPMPNEAPMARSTGQSTDRRASDGEMDRLATIAPAARNATSMILALPLTNVAIMARKISVANQARSYRTGRESSTSLTK